MADADVDDAYCHNCSFSSVSTRLGLYQLIVRSFPLLHLILCGFG